MSYSLTPASFLRHLAFAYRKHKNDFAISEKQYPQKKYSGHEIKAHEFNNEQIQVLAQQLEILEKKYAEFLLDNALDDETMKRISAKIAELRQKLNIPSH